MSETPGTHRTRIRRNARRAEYDGETMRAVLDANRVCHVAYVEEGEPRIIPTLYMRRGEHVYLHGNRQAALLRHLAAGGFAALSVMSVDGIVVARSGFHCSMNYRSLVLFGHGEPVPETEQAAILDAFVEALIPGHLARVRAPTPQELAATTVVRIPIDEASAKIRTGPAIDDEADLDAAVWAGVIPLFQMVGTPVPNPDLKPGIPVPDYVEDYKPPA
ncbi:MAG: pyridoxamine 5'-phosphate oxidase family protein [Pseudomonadales bacterium]|jgi:nitroimidazol reductase NimA-like FMN-containing flavoprotein (pyridoxamine 5'-phosphate oxidase superfamily)